METIYPDIPRICTAMAEWIMCFAYVSFLPQRYTGRKSIRYSIEKYGGNITTAYKDNWFELCILIPMQKEDEH